MFTDDELRLISRLILERRSEIMMDEEMDDDYDFWKPKLKLLKEINDKISNKLPFLRSET